jgi:hypothetical protein
MAQAILSQTIRRNSFKPAKTRCEHRPMPREAPEKAEFPLAPKMQ